MPMVTVNSWNRGITSDPFDKRGLCKVCTGFDVFSYKQKMSPYRSSESGDSSASTSKKKNFAIALWGPTGAYRLFGLGVVSGTARAEILMKDLTTGGTNDLSDATWVTPNFNSSSSGTTNPNLFVYYKQTGKIYGAQAGTHIWAFTPDGATVFDETHQAVSYTNLAQGLVHSKDDILYIPYDNKIAKNNAGSWNLTALTLPNNLYITSLCEYGNYLAIACAPLSGVAQNSVVYLWDRDSTLVTLSESINWGMGSLKVIEEIDGYLVGISLVGGVSSTTQDRIVFKSYSGGGAIKFAELIGTSSTTLSIAKQKLNSRLYFSASIVLNGTRREGVWSVGKQGINEPFGINHERTPNNDTALTSGSLFGFIYVDDYLFQSYESSGSMALSKTDDQANYTVTAIYESVINPLMDGGDYMRDKTLKAVSLHYNKLPTSGQVVLKYKVDEASSYTTIFTETTDNVVATEVTAQADGSPFNSGRYFEFRIESTGGAEVAELRYVYEVNKTMI